MVQHADIDHTGVPGVPASGGASDLVYVATPADTAINSLTDVTIVTRNVTGVAAGDQLVVDGWFLILNDSGSGRVYNMSLDFDGVFPAEMVTASLANSSTIMHQFHIRGVFDVRSNALTYGYAEVYGGATTGNTDDANMTMVATPLSASVWGSQTTDVTGTVTVTFAIRSASATATQTCRLFNFSIRKQTPT